MTIALIKTIEESARMLIAQIVLELIAPASIIIIVIFQPTVFAFPGACKH